MKRMGTYKSVEDRRICKLHVTVLKKIENFSLQKPGDQDI